MILNSISIQNFRNYKKFSTNFSSSTTIIVGPNTAGKTNLIESIALLSTGKSFKADKDIEVIKFNEDVCRIKAEMGETLEIVIADAGFLGKESPTKKYLVNEVAKRRSDFAGNLLTVVFSPQDLEIIIDSPSIRRNFLNSVLEQTDREYRLAITNYEKGLRQRNALLELAKNTGRRNERQFEYWDELLIQNGQIVTKKREEFIDFLNKSEKPIFDFVVEYDKSVISRERLDQYKDKEIGATVTLVGPHRDDIKFLMLDKKDSTVRDVKLYGSRGQQRLVVLQLKLLELNFIDEKTGQRPLLLLDDIFSELDEKHINLVMGIISKQQTIITSTHEELIPKKLLGKIDIIKIENERV